ncbi:MAG: D-alanyl-D-alanine carboxypeptidase, partial [Myxococcales bacterium]|nr:D-alanyl-D-alanine carboxypeptidase [Myxococcales bacterium]
MVFHSRRFRSRPQGPRLSNVCSVGNNCRGVSRRDSRRYLSNCTAADNHDPARFDGEPLRPYNVGPDALLLNFKSIRLGFVPDAERKSLAVYAEPAPAQLDIVNLVKLTDAACGNAWYEGIRMDLAHAGAGARLVLTGSYPAACGEKSRHVAVLDHPQFIAGVFRQLWGELGGTFSGNLREGATPAAARLLARSESPALAEV